VRVVRRAVERGVELIDTADSCGPTVSEEILHEARHPYPDRALIATKAGLVRTGPSQWHPVGRPEYLRQECELSLRRLGVERIDPFQRHRIDPKVPAEEQFGLLSELLAEGKVGPVGLSQVGVDEIEAARKVVPIVTVQNRYSVGHRMHEDVVEPASARASASFPGTRSTAASWPSRRRARRGRAWGRRDGLAGRRRAAVRAGRARSLSPGRPLIEHERDACRSGSRCSRR
jgi:aryl-alcohol dehydrogenase-like predicted oxidoreductase